MLYRLSYYPNFVSHNVLLRQRAQWTGIDHLSGAGVFPLIIGWLLLGQPFTRLTLDIANGGALGKS